VTPSGATDRAESWTMPIRSLPPLQKHLNLQRQKQSAKYLSFHYVNSTFPNTLLQ
jgi:hypothetical protein